MSDEIPPEVLQELSAMAARYLLAMLIGTLFGAGLVAAMAYEAGRLTGSETVFAIGGAMAVMALTALGVFLVARFAVPRMVLWAYDGDLEKLVESGEDA